MEKNDEINLVQAASKGDADSFSRLCTQYYPVLVAIAYSQLSDKDLAEDAAQEALFVAFRDISKLKNSDLFVSWLTRICRNISFDMAKKRKRDEHIRLENCEIRSKEKTQDDNCDEILRNIIAKLPLKSKEVVFLKFYNKLSYEEISTVLGISLEAVNGRLRRAKKLIAKELNRQDSVEVEL
ncbi:MAG: sigma-70 family RNA polymerase sigma factor [Sedimentisphaerales bacterium]|nr:sigma-70 family RNA polymerase sigma factor [Sedimentisphaerales bacterium]